MSGRVPTPMSYNPENNDESISMEEREHSIVRKSTLPSSSVVSLRGRLESKALITPRKRRTLSTTNIRPYIPSKETSAYGSIFSRELFAPKLQYSNTYRLESKNPFNRDQVTNAIKEVLERELTSLKKYDPHICKDLCFQIAQEIRMRVRLMEFDRYKIITRVHIVEKFQQGIHINSCYLWDAERDMFATYQYENMYVRAIATVYGMYCE